MIPTGAVSCCWLLVKERGEEKGRGRERRGEGRGERREGGEMGRRYGAEGRREGTGWRDERKGQEEGTGGGDEKEGREGGREGKTGGRDRRQRRGKGILLNNMSASKRRSIGGDRMELGPTHLSSCYQHKLRRGIGNVVVGKRKRKKKWIQ